MTERTLVSSGAETPYEAYVAQVAACAREGRLDPLRTIILDRLKGKPKTVGGLVSPGLDRDESDHALALMNVFDRLAAGTDGADIKERRLAAQGVRYFREVLVDLAQAHLHHGFDPDVYAMLGDLIAHCGVAEDAEMRERLENALWGYLVNRLPKRFVDVAGGGLPGGKDERARAAFDLWLAITDPVVDGEPVPDHVTERLAKAFKAAAAARRRNPLQNAPGYWMLLLFRGMAKLDARRAAREVLPVLLDHMGDANRDPETDAEADFMDEAASLCWEYTRGFAAHPRWGSAFLAGIADVPVVRSGQSFDNALRQWLVGHADPTFAASLEEALRRRSASAPRPRDPRSFRVVETPADGAVVGVC